MPEVTSPTPSEFTTPDASDANSLASEFSMAPTEKKIKIVSEYIIANDLELRKHIYFVCRKLNGKIQWHDFQDIYQEMIVKALKNVGGLDKLDYVRPWLTRIAKNHYLDTLRNNTNHKTLRESDLTDSNLLTLHLRQTGSPLESLGASHSGTETDLIAKNLIEIISTSPKLTKEEKRLLELKYVFGLLNKEIFERVKKENLFPNWNSEDSVKPKFTNILKKLRGILAEHGVQSLDREK